MTKSLYCAHFHFVAGTQLAEAGCSHRFGELLLIQVRHRLWYGTEPCMNGEYLMSHFSVAFADMLGRATPCAAKGCRQVNWKEREDNCLLAV